MRIMLWLSIAFLSIQLVNAKVIYLISTPRSLSTVFTRMMDAREDVDAFNEPWFPIYMKNKFPHVFVNNFKKDTPVTWDEVDASLEEAEKTKIVFVKDIACAFLEKLKVDSTFVKDSKNHFIFLTRDLGDVICSYSRGIQKPEYLFIATIPDKISEVVGTKVLLEVFERVKGLSPNPVYIVKAEDLYNNPEGTVRAFCKAVGIPFSKDTLSWPAYGDNFERDCTWHGGLLPEYAHYWYGGAIRSTGFKRPTVNDRDENGNHTFSHENHPKRRAVLHEVHRRLLPYYKQLMAAKDHHLKPLAVE